ncbi:MAG: hypothetical protein M3Z08_21295 [Chloroflexota bacterium]|nr:hypothetical protein [Chloroflexota bacterium]
MVSTRTFVCHNINEEAPHDVQALDQLLYRLQEAGADVSMYKGHTTDTGFLPFLNQELPTCQWFILLQTPEAIGIHQVEMAVQTALKLVEQGHMQEAVRFIVRPTEQQELPASWSMLTAFDATYDYPRAMEKLLLSLAITKPALAVTTLAPPPLPRFSQAPSPGYDRPPASPSGWSKFKTTLQNIQQGDVDGRRRLIMIFTVLLVITLLASVLGVFVLNRPAATRPAPVGRPVYGHVYFFSTGFTGDQNITGICDGIQLNLSNLKSPAPGNSYYAWLLPDKNDFSGLIQLVGKLTPANGSVQFRYASPTHANLLATDSRFLITEESATIVPDSPSANKALWRYYAEIPQAPNPNDTTFHYSNLNHLRHLLALDPKLHLLSLEGGLNIWFFQDVRKILEWANAAAGTGQLQPQLMHRQFIRILDYLDGVNYVHLDVPAGTPIVADPQIARVPLLTLDPANENPPGYIHHIELHLLGLTDSPNTTKEQRELAGQIDIELNKVRVNLEQVRQDASKLVNMTNAQLLDPANLPTIDDLVSQANIAFVGQVDPTTDSRVGGATWIFDHMQQLAQLTVTQYTA